MLKRYAVLIGSTRGTPSLPGVRNDLALIKNYLKSCHGGGWRDDEIRMFLDSPAPDILDRVEQLRRGQPDYLLFYYSGHGYAKEGVQMLQPSPEDTVPLDCFSGVADRQLMILDTCRKYSPPTAFLMATAFNQAMAPTDRERKRYRKVYDHYLAECEPSLQIAYACALGENAATSLHGSYYTKSLVQRALRWQLPSRHRHGFASIRRLMKTPTGGGAQSDYYHSDGGISPLCFPFAVACWR
jgi:hypothetical protein